MRLPEHCEIENVSKRNVLFDTWSATIISSCFGHTKWHMPPASVLHAAACCAAARHAETPQLRGAVWVPGTLCCILMREHALTFRCHVRPATSMYSQSCYCFMPCQCVTVRKLCRQYTVAGARDFTESSAIIVKSSSYHHSAHHYSAAGAGKC